MFLHESDLPPLITIALAHYQFEAIHPFLDGNGRVGRLLITLFLIERKILPTPLLYLAAFFEASRRDYYDGLLTVSARGAWNEWLEYFLQGVARMSEDALSRATRINGLLVEWHGKLADHSTNTPIRVLGLLAANPFVIITGAANQLNLAFTTVRRAIDRLESSGIVRQVSDAKRDRVCCAQELLDILEEPAHLASFMWGIPCSRGRVSWPSSIQPRCTYKRSHQAVTNRGTNEGILIVDTCNAFRINALWLPGGQPINKQLSG